MTKITVLPHPTICPDGTTFEAKIGVSVCDNLLQHHVEIEHACEKVAACTTCHVIVRQGYNSLNEIEDQEEDLLDMAWGLTSVSRLSCQAIVADEDLVIEMPKYTKNHASEGSH
ncbi:2Fe-2S ferredoxin [Ephemeroptericola cinctiostellae]|uniref:2Fe-2S ferredoxin n=1 Tax=Ephemeroptericola cinctiostellae TaxID=2268024 RepID=A0A345D9J5_9BURK|nr:ISC system 2Fe-2S type ferredoxin [Ephemeroptericola cinctiostellae]AXF85033.1 2Fe-2S ferredoxin [Ephemeroptericola cinctiostellae]